MSYQPSEDLKRLQKVLEQIEERKQLRVRLVGEMKSKEVELEKLDHSIQDLRKQYDAEVQKLDPELSRRTGPHLVKV